VTSIVSLPRAVLACHVALAFSIALAILSGGVTPSRGVLTALALAPLLATLLGLA